jgi:transcriptional regulator with XRE-family HTH domain
MLSNTELMKTPEYWVEVIQNRLFEEVHNYLSKEQMTQTQLAEQLGVSKGYISQILNGNFNHTLRKLVEISLAIGVVPDVNFKKVRATNSEKRSYSFRKQMNADTEKNTTPFQIIPNSNMIIPLRENMHYGRSYPFPLSKEN